MFKKIVPYNTKVFANKRVKPVTTFDFARQSHLATLMVSECSRAAGIYPIVFLKEGDSYGLYALLGLTPNENLFIDENGHWKSSYVPAIIRRYPFVLAKTQDADNFMLGIDEESDFINDSEGEPLVGPDGKPSQMVENAKQFLTELHRTSLLTKRFCKELEDRDLLHPLSLQVKSGNETMQNIAGCFGVNEKKFNELPDEAFLDLRKRGALPIIYAHLISLGQLERLVRLQTEKKR